jgi:NAD(P)-dependent dehydrogenase (short-subunit alcohol dehydrogenase family)
MGIARFGRVDILANIAGAFPTALLADTTDEQFEVTLAANLTGTFMMCRALLPAMLRQGSGAIVNMSSMAARFPTPGLSVYSASKAGIEAFTRAIAAEAAPNVRVNTVSAGPTLTEAVAALVASDTTGAVAAVTRSLPLSRMGTPEEIAEAVLFLASARASFVTGQTLHVNGGGLMA